MRWASTVADAQHRPDQTSAGSHAAASDISEADVRDSPLERGTDALGDHGRPGRSGVKLALAAILTVFFALFVITDVVNRSWGRACLGMVVLALCGAIVWTELKKSRT